MTQIPTELRVQELEDYIEAYEIAQSGPEAVELTDFLPPADHPLRRQVLGELVRIDLEYGWRRGRPHALEHYQKRFPELRTDRAILQEIAFEEYRLRRMAGENPSPRDYEQRLGVETASWPQPEPGARNQNTAAVDSGASLAQLHARRAAQTFVIGPAPDPGLEEAALAYKEFRLSQQAEDASALDSWRDSFSGDAPHADLFRDVHRTDPEAAYNLAQAATSMPEAGSDFLGFRLLEELGRGAFGRVYLAQQGDLANRHVALKISTNLLGESQTLAQLQHTNIVPIYSVHKAGPFQAVCMPYFGATTLADVLKDLEKRDSLPESGKQLVSTLNARKSTTRTRASSKASAVKGTASLPPSPPSPAAAAGVLPRGEATDALKRLEGYTYVNAVLWMGLRLAEGLAHAHERGILHRDLKPANILLTDDGQPMLLDFNLSEDTKLRDNASAALIGGTLPYMAPEHLEAFQGGKRPVDSRSDIYSFGVILYELLTGRNPFTIPRSHLHSVLPDMIQERLQKVPEVRRWNRGISWSVESIIRHCLEPDPARRYQSAEQLREDLERHLDDRPLKYAPELALRERADKWMRRHPRLAWASLAIVGGVVILAASFSLIWQRDRLTALQAETNFPTAREDIKTAHALLVAKAGEVESVREGVTIGRSVLQQYGLLSRPDWENEPGVRSLPVEKREALTAELGAMAVFLARLASEQDQRPGFEQTRREARAVLSEEEIQRLQQVAQEMRLPPARELCQQARKQITEGHYRDALRLLQEAARLDRQDYWVWWLLGNCADGLGQDSDAITNYSLCLAHWPQAYPAHFNRGLAWQRLKDQARAKEDFDRVLKLRPELADGYFYRAIASMKLGKNTEALEDITRAMALKPQDPRIYFVRSRIRKALGNSEGAEQDYEAGMRREPVEAIDWSSRGYEKLQRGDPAGALADFDQALEINPVLFTALQNKVHVLGEHLHRTEEAVKVLDFMVATFPDHVPTRSTRGVYLARLSKRDAALADAREALAGSRDKDVLYQVAGIYALTSRHHPEDLRAAFQLLAQALLQGYGFDLLAQDTDLDPIRSQPEFRRLAEAARALQSAAANQPSR